MPSPVRRSVFLPPMLVGVLVLCLTMPVLAEDGATLEPLAESLQGVWEQIEPEVDPGVRIELTPDAYTRVEGDKVAFRAPVLGQRADGTVVISLFCNRIDHHVEHTGTAASDETLVLTWTPAITKFRPEPETERVTFRRLAERPAVFDLAPLPLGDADTPLAEERVVALRDELITRGERDQEIRKAFQKPGGVSQEIQDEMRAIDADNVAYLIPLLAEVGWIDAQRFSREASRAAWLIVQHSGDLALMTAVLPQLERSVRDSGEGGSDFALLWDRSRIWLGHKQRYGSQVFFGPEGMFIAPLEDPDTVDARRAALGLDPLDDYREFFRERNDGKPLPIRTEF